MFSLAQPLRFRPLTWSFAHPPEWVNHLCAWYYCRRCKGHKARLAMANKQRERIEVVPPAEEPEEMPLPTDPKVIFRAPLGRGTRGGQVDLCWRLPFLNDSGVGSKQFILLSRHLLQHCRRQGPFFLQFRQ